VRFALNVPLIIVAALIGFACGAAEAIINWHAH
jgi:hypothetical protein